MVCSPEGEGTLYVERARPVFRDPRRSTARSVFSLMTSFTWRCQDILYTSPRRGWRRRALVRGQNGVGNGGRRRTKGTFCGACEPAREEHAGIVPGVCDFASDRLRVVTTLPGEWHRWSSGEEPTTALQSGTHGEGDRAARDRAATTAAGLGSAEVAGVAGRRRAGAAGHHHPPYFAAAWFGAAARPASSSGAAFCAWGTEPALADGL